MIEERSLQRLSYGLIALTLALLTAALSVAALSSLRTFERVLEPQLEAKAIVVAEVIASEVERAMQAGVPLDRLVGVATFADELRARMRFGTMIPELGRDLRPPRWPWPWRRTTFRTACATSRQR